MVGQGDGGGIVGIVERVDEGVASGVDAGAERACRRFVCSMCMLRALWRRGMARPGGRHLADSAMLA